MSRRLLTITILAVCLAGCSNDTNRRSVAVNSDIPTVFGSGGEYGKANGFPTHWWDKITTNDKADWEIAPDEAKPGELILSKRTELGIFSNFAATPFVLDGRGYASIEGFWQAVKFPDPELPDDPRFQLSGWPMKRDQVEKLSGSNAKKAGSAASQILESAGIDWVSYRGLTMIYREPGNSTFYQLIVRAMIAKLQQNPKVRELLLSTKELRLLPDHKPGEKDQKAWKYHLIWEDLRKLAAAKKI